MQNKVMLKPLQKLWQIVIETVKKARSESKAIQKVVDKYMKDKPIKGQTSLF